MLIDIAEIRAQDKPLRLDDHRSAAALGLEDDLYQLIEPVRFTCTVSVQGERVRVAGALKAHLQLNCSRCLRGFGLEIDKKFDVKYMRDPVVESEDEEFCLTYEDLDVGFYRNDQLDLDPVLAEQILLDVPMKPICSTGCKGLCDQCGADLNQGACGCERVHVDPRWEALGEIKRRLDH